MCEQKKKVKKRREGWIERCECRQASSGTHKSQYPTPKSKQTIPVNGQIAINLNKLVRILWATVLPQTMGYGV
jgi:hypothetical protein